MRREPEHFGESELDLIYIARKLKDAIRVESLFTEMGVDYAVEADNYQGGVVFRTERVGAFFYVLPQAAEFAREILRTNGFQG